MTVNAKIKNTLSFFLRVGLSLALLIYVFSKVDLAKTAEILKTADLGYIFLAAVTFIICMTILCFRWFIFIKALDLSASRKNVILHYFYGMFGNLFLPTAIGGDLLKAVGLCKSSAQKTRVVASILLDRLSGFASIALVAVIAFIFGYRYIDDKISVAVPILLMGLGTVSIAAVLFNEPVYSFCCRIFSRLPLFRESLMKMHYDIALLKESNKYKEGFKAILLSCVSQIIFAFSYYFTAMALHQDISIIYFLIFVPIICVISSFPSIGGLGVREVGSAYLFAKIGIESGIAVSLTLINFLFMVMVGIAGGVLYVYTLSTGRIQHYSPDVSSEPGAA